MTPERMRHAATTLGVREAPVGGLLVLVLLVDAGLILIHVALEIAGGAAHLLDLGVDRGYAEFFQYVKTTWVFALLLMLAIRGRERLYLAWSLVFAFLVLDDALLLHEGAGLWVAWVFPHLGGVAVHLGELAWLGAFGLVLGCLVLIAHRRAHPRAQAVSAVLLVLSAVLVLFGVVLDAVHHILFDTAFFDVPLTTIEDGGELVTMSFVLAFVFAVAFAGHVPVLRGRLAKWAITPEGPRSRDSHAPSQPHGDSAASVARIGRSSDGAGHARSNRSTG